MRIIQNIKDIYKVLICGKTNIPNVKTNFIQIEEKKNVVKLSAQVEIDIRYEMTIEEINYILCNKISQEIFKLNLVNITEIKKMNNSYDYRCNIYTGTVNIVK